MSGHLDPWLHILETLEPDYPILKKLLLEQPKIKIKLEEENNLWLIWLEQDWIDHEMDNFDSDKFDSHIKWIDTNIKSWNGHIENFNLYSFKSKLDAEKFIIYYSLSWDQ